MRFSKELKKIAKQSKKPFEEIILEYWKLMVNRSDYITEGDVTQFLNRKYCSQRNLEKMI